jgi:RNA polymerase-binding transcription factor DksA
MMTTATATSTPATDSASAYPGHTTTPPSLGRSDTPPRDFDDMRRDAVALTWDLTVHQLLQAFSRCMAAPSTDLPNVGASQELARTRLAAARHAVDDIQAALNRMACGTYGRCQQCGRMIAADHLQASPTARWCATCQV